MPADHARSHLESSSLDELRNSLNNLRCHAVPNYSYFDSACVKELCAPELIEAAVKDCPFPDYQKSWICKCILEKGFLTFSILVHIEKEYLFLDFLEHDVRKMLDHRLPLGKTVLQVIAPRDASRFFDVQWQFIPVKLPRYEHLNIGNDYVMPFVKDDPMVDKTGSFGDIFKVTIKYSMQHALELDKQVGKREEVCVIRKQIRFQGNNVSFKNEKECLETLRQLRHPNIVELLCSYTYRDLHNFIFPDEGMNLSEFLETESSEKTHGDFHSNKHTFYRAMYGLVSAVEVVHSNFKEDEGEQVLINIGYHHDIRPHNILVRWNTFLLADFGLAKIRNEEVSSTLMKGGGAQYMAPEGYHGERIGREADIWSLGAVFLDIAAYMDGGPTGRKKAQKERASRGQHGNVKLHHFFSPSGMELHTGVQTTIERLENNAEDKTIRTLLLVSKDMLKVQKDVRPNVHNVRCDMAYVAIKSLFRAALQYMIQRSKGLWTSIAEVADGKWHDTWKLWAWGEEIGINGVNHASKRFTDALPYAGEHEKRIQSLLHELVCSLKSEKFLGRTENSRNSPKDVLIGEQSKDEPIDPINKCIKKLRDALPTNYVGNINNRRMEYLQFARKDGYPGWPDISDEPLPQGKCRYP